MKRSISVPGASEQNIAQKFAKKSIGIANTEHIVRDMMKANLQQHVQAKKKKRCEQSNQHPEV